MSAVISLDQKYRYTLTRKTGLVEPQTKMASITFVMLNPSTADANADDPTIRRCVGFAKKWLAEELIVLNLYAYRATEPAELRFVDDPVGPMNELFLSTALWQAAGVVCAWGANAHPDEVAKLRANAAEHDCALWCLGTNKDGSPKHPLYIPAETEPRVWV